MTWPESLVIIWRSTIKSAKWPHRFCMQWPLGPSTMACIRSQPGGDGCCGGHNGLKSFLRLHSQFSTHLRFYDILTKHSGKAFTNRNNFAHFFHQKFSEDFVITIIGIIQKWLNFIVPAYQISQHRLTDNYTYGFRLLCSIQLLWLVYIIIPGLGPSLDRRGCALCIFSVFTIQAAKKHKETLWMNDTLEGKNDKTLFSLQ